MLTSLGLASDGLLDRGDLPTLHIASLGHLRTSGAVVPDGGGGGRLVPLPGRPLTERERERLRKAKQRGTAATKRAVEELLEPELDVTAFEQAIERAQREALSRLPEREPSGRRQRPPRVEIEPEAFIRPIIGDDIHLRLLLLLGC